MPNHIGAFLKASRTFAELGINITRVSYNKAIDSHMLFIDVEGDEEQIEKADIELENIGYLPSGEARASIVLIEFHLEDVPGSVTSVLTLINEFNFNISYLSSSENGSGYQDFKMGLCVSDFEKLSHFLKEAEKICRVRVLDYNGSEKVFDNSFFYNTYVDSISGALKLPNEKREELLINVNLAMQTLDESGLAPFQTFDSIRRAAELIAASKGENFAPRISTHKITENTEITVIEPPCGSNTMIIKSFDKYLFVDSGYACYKTEMLAIFRKLIPEYDSIEKCVYITHADVDHCGLLPLFDKVIGSYKSVKSLENEHIDGGYREENPVHLPYVNICKMVTEYKPVAKEKLVVAFGDDRVIEKPLEYIGKYTFGDLYFDVYEGKGGHLVGETVLVDSKNRIAITGDIYVNMHGQTPEQAEYNRYAPILMTSVDTIPSLCKEERLALMSMLGSGEWQIFGAHGMKKDYGM